MNPLAVTAVITHLVAFEFAVYDRVPGVMEALGPRGGEKVGGVFVEEYLHELWERTLASS